MTTHDQQTDTAASTAPVSSTGRPDPLGEVADSSAGHTEASTTPADASSTAMRADASATQHQPRAVGDQSSRPATEPSDVDAGRSGPATEPRTPADRSGDESLFAHADLSGLRSRWDDVQAAFVDDPKECVQKADALVAEVVEFFSAVFTEARSRLEEQWARGDEASTEDLRIALTRYREFFQRLLAV